MSIQLANPVAQTDADLPKRRAMPRRAGFFTRLWAKPSAASLALAELEEAQRQLLASQTAQEYAANMAKYHAQRIARLRAFLREEAGEDA